MTGNVVIFNSTRPFSGGAVLKTVQAAEVDLKQEASVLGDPKFKKQFYWAKKERRKLRHKLKRAARKLENAQATEAEQGRNLSKLQKRLTAHKTGTEDLFAQYRRAKEAKQKLKGPRAPKEGPMLVRFEECSKMGREAEILAGLMNGK